LSFINELHHQNPFISHPQHRLPPFSSQRRGGAPTVAGHVVLDANRNGAPSLETSTPGARQICFFIGLSHILFIV